MSEPPKMPSMPVMPPKLSKDVIKDNLCFIHKGELTENVYTCKCGVRMCMDCAIERKKSKNRLCPKCSSVIIFSN